MFENSDEILTVAQVSEMLYIGINTTYDLLNTGKIKGFRVGRVWKIPRDALIDFVLERQQAELTYRL